MKALWKGLVAFWGVVLLVVVGVNIMNYVTREDLATYKAVPKFKDIQEEMTWVSINGDIYTFESPYDSDMFTFSCNPDPVYGDSKKRAKKAFEALIEGSRNMTNELRRSRNKDSKALMGEMAGKIVVLHMTIYEKYHCLGVDG